MAKKLSANPADAHRKQQRQKELKRNKQNRKETREIQVVKKDTAPLEAEIRKLSERRGQLNQTDQAHLNQLKAELAKIIKAKTDYVEAHPEHRKFVFPERKTASGPSGSGGAPQREPPGLYNRDGKLKHPERSAYYDPVFNPFGAPPPGMPYREREPTEEEMRAWYAPPPLLIEPDAEDEEESEEDSDEDDEDDDDDEILMPEGAPPPLVGAGAPPRAQSEEEEESSSGEDSDGIQLPEGPPPPRPDARVHINRPQQNGQRFPPRPHHNQHPNHHPYPPNPNFRGSPNNRFQQPRPPPGAPHGPRHQGQQHPHALPPRPPPLATQDPLSDAPGHTYQSHQAQRFAQATTSAGPAPLPAPPPNGPSSSAPSSSAPPNVAGPAFPGAFSVPSAGGSATISAAPRLRDLKKEATAFMPTAMRKKLKAEQAAKASHAGLGVVNAAPSGAQGAREGEEGGEGGKREERASLMGALKGVGMVGGKKEAESERRGEKVDRGREDYERFEREMGEFL